MALDDFRRTDLIIDKATQRIDWQAPLRAVQGEYNGRSLRVQLTNNGIVEPQTAQLLFGFYCAVNHKEGVYDMTAVDLSKGIYEVFYPSDMLLEYGTVACTIKIIENAGSSENESHITILDGISVEVAENPISGQAEVAENSIRVFDKALIDISAHERRILLMELNFQELAQMLTLNIPNMDVPVSTRASEVTVNNIQDTATLTLEKVRQLFPAGATKTFNTPGTHTFKVPAGVGIITVFCVGAGGGGGGGGKDAVYANIGGSGGGGGGGGGTREGAISVTPGSNLTVVVGAGGAGGAGHNTTGDAGGTGGSSSAGGIVATGGSGGRGGYYDTTGKNDDVPGAGGAGGILEGNPGTASGRGDKDFGKGGAAPSVYGSYGIGGNGGVSAVARGVAGDGAAGLGGFVRLSY